MTDTGIIKSLEPFRRRALARRATTTAVAGLATGLAVIDLLALGLAVPLGNVAVLVVIGAATASGLVFGIVTTPTASALAVQLDAQFCLQNRLSTALAFANHDDPFSALVRRDAAQAAASLDPRAAITIRIAPGMVATVAILTLMVPVTRTFQAAGAPAAGVERHAGAGVAAADVASRPAAAGSTADEGSRAAAAPAARPGTTLREMASPAGIDARGSAQTGDRGMPGQQVAATQQAGHDASAANGGGAGSGAAKAIDRISRQAGGVRSGGLAASTTLGARTTAGYSHTYQAGERALETALAHDAVPVRWQTYVKRYFAAVRPE